MNEQGPITVLLKDGTILKAHRVVPTAEGIETRDEDDQPNAVLDAYQLDVVLTGNEPTIEAAGERNFIAALLLKIEHVVKDWEKFRQSDPKFAYRFPHISKLTIFGSGSLNLTLLPDRVSHDLDIITDDRSWQYLNDQIRTLSSGKVTVNLHTDNLLDHVKGWENRAAHLIGAGGLLFQVVHPLDTLSQKLLRESEEQFRTKDEADIQRILAVLRPPEDVLIKLLRSGYQRFFDPVNAVSAKRNTESFLKKYLPNIDLQKDIIDVAIQKKRRSLEITGLSERPKNKWERILDKNELLEP
jgi:hypothetical protein